MDNPITVNLTVDQITQGDMLLQRFNADLNKLTEVTLVSNRREIPESTGGVRYEAIPADRFVGEHCKDWDSRSPITLYFNEKGFDHYEKTAGATAGAAA